MQTINVRILVRSDLDPTLAVEQLLRGVLKAHGTVELIRNASGQLVPVPQVNKRPHVAWQGEEIHRD